MQKRLITIPILPGIRKEDTDYTAEARWIDGDKIRFWQGKLEQIGGWTKYDDSDTITGVGRGLHSWRDLSSNLWFATGTDQRLYVYDDSFTDITPLRKTVNPMGADPFTTTDSDATVSVADTGHGAVIGGLVLYSGATAVNGITIDGVYEITAVADANTYSIEHTSAASGSGAGGGSSVIAKYYIASGSVSGTTGLGYGTGTYGTGTYGTIRTAGTGIGINFEPRVWIFDNWGEDLVCTPWDTKPYIWDTSVGTSTRATAVTNAPNCLFAKVTEERHMIAFGAEDESGDRDNLLVRWCDQEDYTDWTATALNTAGDYRLTGGFRINAAINSRGQTLIFTDRDLWGMQFVGPPFTFGFLRLGINCGAISPLAAVDANGIAFWMSKDNFYLYDGQVRAIPCEVHEHVFTNLKVADRFKVWAVANEAFNEVWWFYQKSGETDISHYVTYNYADRNWTVGTLVRTAGVDALETDNPIYLGYNGYLYAHESGTQGDGTDLDGYGETGEFELEEGDDLLFVDRLIPDWTGTTTDLGFSLKTRRYPGDSTDEVTKGPYSTTATTNKVDLRARGRQFALRVDNAASGDFRLGNIRARIKKSGRR